MPCHVPLVWLGRRLARRRLFIAGGGLAAALGPLAARPALGQPELLTVSGAGVNVKEMPSPDGEDTVPLRESFAFDPHYAQCIIEDNLADFAMDTYSMGQVVVDAHTFFMAMYATQVRVAGITRGEGRSRIARLVGELDCLTEAGVANTTVGSRSAAEAANFEIQAVDGGFGGSRMGDSFAFTVFFDPGRAPVNHAIFGPNPTFTGTMVAGEVTIAPAATLPVTG